MPITYVRLVHSKPDPVVFRSPFEEPCDGNVLLFDPTAEATSATIGDLFKQLDGSLLANDLIVFRGTGRDFLTRFNEDHILPSLLTSTKAAALVSATQPTAPGPTWYPFRSNPLPAGIPSIETIRQAELVAILQRNLAVFESKEYHYALPSGWHANKFVRLGDALRTIYDVQRIAEWLLPYVSKHTVVVGDTGSILPLLMSLRELAKSHLGWDVAICTLDEYPRDRLAIMDAVQAANKRPAVAAAQYLGADLTWLFVISVNSSGRLCSWLSQHMPAGSKIVVVCQTSSDATPCHESLATVLVERKPIDATGKCELCNNHSHVIHVHPESYELLPKIEFKAVKVDKAVAESRSWFWTMANDADAVELHADVAYPAKGPEGRRHFSILLKTDRLAAHPPFREKCLAELRKVEKPGVVLVPDHPNTESLIGLCREAHPDSPICVLPHGPIPASMHSDIEKAGRILVADDSVVTGATLKYLRSDIYRVTQLLKTDPDVCAFAMVTRPSTMADVETIRRRYTGAQGRRFFSPIIALMPDGQSCPWCAELKFLNRFRGDLKGDSLTRLNERIDWIERHFQPPLLMVSPPHDHKDLKSLGSFFGSDLGARAAFAAGSSAAQTIIQDLATLGGGIQFKVADLAMAYDAYYEGVILAGLLRTFHAIHVRCPSHDPLVEAKIRNIDPSKAYPGVLTELALAALMGKVPSRPVREALEAWKDKDLWIPMLLDIFKIVEPM